MYYVIAKYKSKYGLIVYVTKVSDNNSFSVDLNNCYINTFILKVQRMLILIKFILSRPLKVKMVLRMLFFDILKRCNI